MIPNWHSPRPFIFMKSMTLESENNEPAVLSVQYRHEVASRYWWTVEWTDASGQRRSESAQSVELLFERAIKTELAIRERIEAEEKKCLQVS